MAEATDQGFSRKFRIAVLAIRGGVAALLLGWWALLVLTVTALLRVLQ